MFRDRVRRATRRRSRLPFDGTGVNATSLLLSASSYQIENVFDAAYAAQSIYNVYSEATLPTALTVLRRSLRYRLEAMRGGRRFPSAELWTQTSPADNA
jgi:hypothetical protein